MESQAGLGSSSGKWGEVSGMRLMNDSQCQQELGYSQSPPHPASQTWNWKPQTIERLCDSISMTFKMQEQAKLTKGIEVH